MKSSLLCACGAVLASQVVATGDTSDKHDRPLVSSQALQDLVDTKGLLRGSQQLEDFAYSYPDRNRVFGGQAHNDTVQWIAENLSATGYYDVAIQEFVEVFSGGNATLSLDGQDTPVGLFTYAPRGGAQAPLVAVSNLGCNTTDFSSDVSGNVALISRGSCPFADKASNAKTAGAAAAIIYDNVESETPATGTLGGVGDYVPVVGITKAAGEALLQQLQSATVEANVQVNSILENRTTYNVIAETKEGDHENVLALGAHTDSVEAGPGINDDGSGLVGILEVAKSLSHFSINNAVRFCFWSAEEFGLLGSTYYVSQLNESRSEVDKIRAYLNFDMIASPNYVYAIYDGDGSAFNVSGPAGSAEIEHNFERFFQHKSENYVPTAFDGRSDYGPFLDVGIPSGGLFTGAEEIKTTEEAELFGGQAEVALDQCYHQACDNVTNLNIDAYTLNTFAIADAVATYALSFDSLGPRPVNVKRDPATVHARKTRRLANIQSNIGRTHGRGICGHKHAV